MASIPYWTFWQASNIFNPLIRLVAIKLAFVEAQKKARP